MADHEARIDLGITGLGPAEHIGRGGFADVYKAEQISLRRTVAVKVLRARAQEVEVEARFERECHAIGAVSDHPHIVGVHEGGFTRNGRAYLVMEYLPGGSLREHLDDSGPLPVERVVETAMKIARALGEAHRAGVLHRDVKPANIMISAYGEPALGDFGIARIEGGPQTLTGLVTASLAHAAPEVLEGMSPTASADIYSLGTTIFELMVGRPPYYDPTDESIWPLMKRILSEPMPSPESVGMSRQLGRVFLRATNRDPGLRYPDADSMAEELMVLSGDRSAMTRDLSGVSSVGSPQASDVGQSNETQVIEALDDNHRPANLIAGAPPVVGTPGGPPAPKPDLTSFRHGEEQMANSAVDATGRFTPMQSVDRLGEPSFHAAPTAGEAGGQRRGRGVIKMVAVVAVLAMVAGVGLFVNNLRTSDDAAVSGTSQVAVELPEAAAGPLVADTEYSLSLDAPPAGAQFRLVLNGEPVGSPSDAVPTLAAASGRHSVAVEITTATGTETTAPVEFYALEQSQGSEFVANLASVETDRSWNDALAVFDQLVSAGHDDLVLARSDASQGRTPNHWMLYVPGFGDIATDAEDYCRRFELSIPTSCFAGFLQPAG